MRRLDPNGTPYRNLARALRAGSKGGKETARRKQLGELEIELYPGSELTADEVEFGRAMTEYQRRHKRFPRWSEVLRVLVNQLGYRKH